MTKKFDFNKGLIELEEIVSTMESGDLSLEDSLAYFSKGVELTKSCQIALNDASQKISKLTQEDGFTNSTPFENA
ncbi:MAG TPA: exodeoxyribonuclease VII small subunit [Candidatus Thioglobus autotrophicus]|jgi:exodeoxyribonuclease VII small subunit|nr:exodeoxyribonuclease VII small subunit [Candidatus Thioglobus sp.]HIB31210.1 exodeoxyribonuclease VII small subunit [Candidatus Thioglobus sp.]HIB96827.1 exodeoxyribonuclease VII small subunit [Candidatus Thioglobus sp.]HIL03160.1 exodeoxyribonuclease VII small subunit [Candidatus Thioglobus autotrophicus]